MTALKHFDYPFAETPKLSALQRSHAATKAEEDLKNLFIALFTTYLAGDFYDANVSGAQHLGSFDLVRRSVTSDGLTMPQGDRAEEAARYIYRAWKARDKNGRGMIFLKTYLQVLFPNLCEVAQLWQEKGKPYPTALHSTLENDGKFVPDPALHWLTSRIEIALDLTVEARSVLELTDIFRSIVPARLVPQFLFWIRIFASLDIKFDAYEMLVQKDIDIRKPWCGRQVTSRPEAIWKLGKNNNPAAAWKLKNCRAQTKSLVLLEYEAPYGGVVRLDGSRKIDGTWKVSRIGHIGSLLEEAVTIDISASMPQQSAEIVTTRELIIDVDYCYTPKLDGSLKVDGTWKLGGRFHVATDVEWSQESEGVILPELPKLRIGRNVDGTWTLPRYGRMCAEFEMTRSK